MVSDDLGGRRGLDDDLGEHVLLKGQARPHAERGLRASVPRQGGRGRLPNKTAVGSLVETNGRVGG